MIDFLSSSTKNRKRPPHKEACLADDRKKRASFLKEDEEESINEMVQLYPSTATATKKILPVQSSQELTQQSHQYKDDFGCNNKNNVVADDPFENIASEPNKEVETNEITKK